MEAPKMCRDDSCIRIPELRSITLEVFNVRPGNLEYLLSNGESGSVVQEFREIDYRRHWKIGQRGLIIKPLNQSVKGKPK